VNVSDQLERFLEIYRQAAPVMLTEGLKISPPSELAVVAFEAMVGTKLPRSFRWFLLHNTIRHNFRTGYVCLSWEGVTRVWQMMSDLRQQGVFDDGRLEQCLMNGFDDRLQRVWWSDLWIPVSEDSCGNLICLDLAPGPAGEMGQMMLMEIQDGQGPFASPFASFEAYLGATLRDLEEGRFEVREWGLVFLS
jgi:cell wall assembly regulator SMI1